MFTQTDAMHWYLVHRRYAHKLHKIGKIDAYRSQIRAAHKYFHMLSDHNQYAATQVYNNVSPYPPFKP